MSEAAGLYLHVPFCATICPYCDFAVARGDAGARDRFTAALVTEIERAGGTAEAEPPLAGPFDTIYLGGGTPSHLEPRQLESILGAVRRSLTIGPDAFVVMEANPEDVTAPAVADWRGLGVGGLSLGVQSFDGDVLRFLGRRHGGEEGRRAVELALEAGFDWVSLDLIYGSPGAGAGAADGGGEVRRRAPWQGPSPGRGAVPAKSLPWDPLAVALADVDTAIGLGPHHVSCYQLTVHDGTPFAAARDRGRLRELSNDDQATLFLALHEALARGGYPAYEVSSFARGPEHRSRHNTKYWRHVPYLGLGPSAHSFDGGTRWWNLRHWLEWAAAVERGGSPVADRESVGRRQLALEALMLGLRTTDGIAVDRFRDRYGVDLLGANRERIELASREGLLVVVEEQWLRPTPRGLAVADALAASFEL